MSGDSHEASPLVKGVKGARVRLSTHVMWQPRQPIYFPALKLVFWRVLRLKP